MTNTAITVRGETPFPFAGEGAMLLYTNSDLKVLEQTLGAQWFNEQIDSFLSGLVTVERIEFLLKTGLKKERKPFDPGEEFWENYPPLEAGEVIFDALCVSMRGIPAKDLVEKMFAAAREAAENGEVPSLLSPDGPTSTTSEEGASGPASE